MTFYLSTDLKTNQNPEIIHIAASTQTKKQRNFLEDLELPPMAALHLISLDKWVCGKIIYRSTL